MRRISRLPLLAAAALCATPAFADDIFRWVDANGEVHYTNDPSTLPTDQKIKVQKTEGEALTVIPAKAKVPAQQGLVVQPARGTDEAAAKAKTAEKPEEAPSEEARWRERFRKAHDEISALERAIDDDHAKLGDPSAHGINPVFNSARAAVPNPELDKVREHLAKSEQDLQEARRRLDDLEREASRNAVPRDWRR